MRQGEEDGEEAEKESQRDSKASVNGGERRICQYNQFSGERHFTKSL